MILFFYRIIKNSTIVPKKHQKCKYIYIKEKKKFCVKIISKTCLNSPKVAIFSIIATPF